MEKTKLMVRCFGSDVIRRKKSNKSFVRVYVIFNTDNESILKGFESFIKDSPEFYCVRVINGSLLLEFRPVYRDAFGILAMYLDLFNLFCLNN